MVADHEYDFAARERLKSGGAEKDMFGKECYECQAKRFCILTRRLKGTGRY
jgi:hypothetical protein